MHIPGCLIEIADHLSHPNQPIPTEWSLHPEIMRRIFRVWGTPEVDMFATWSNSHLPRIMSPIPEPRALAVDALSQVWQGRSMYLFPPFPLLSRNFAQQSHSETWLHSGGILIAPWWLVNCGFHTYHVSVWNTPVCFPYHRDLLSQQDQKYVLDGKSCHLHAWSQGDSAPAQTVASEPTVDVASIYDDAPQGPEDQSEGEIIESKGDPADAGLPILDNLKMSEEEQRDFDDFSLASVSVPASKRPWRAQGGLEGFKSQAQDVSNTRQARPQAVSRARSVKSTQSDQRSVQLRSVQDQPVSQAQFPVLVSQGQGHRLGRPVVVRHDVIDSLFIEDESSIIDNEAVLKEEQASSEVLDTVAKFCNLDRQDPQIQKEVMGMRLPAYNAPAKKSIKISLPWHSSTFPIVGRIHGTGLRLALEPESFFRGLWLL